MRVSLTLTIRQGVFAQMHILSINTTQRRIFGVSFFLKRASVPKSSHGRHGGYFVARVSVAHMRRAWSPSPN